MEIGTGLHDKLLRSSFLMGTMLICYSSSKYNMIYCITFPWPFQTQVLHSF